jgi:hypothetical protein
MFESVRIFKERSPLKVTNEVKFIVKFSESAKNSVTIITTHKQQTIRSQTKERRKFQEVGSSCDASDWYSEGTLD